MVSKNIGGAMNVRAILFVWYAGSSGAMLVQCGFDE